MSANKLSLAEAHKYISGLEEEYDLLKYQIDGWSIWPLFRAQMFLSQMQLTKESAARSKGGQFNELQFAIKELVRLASLPQASFVFKSDNVNVRADAGGGRLKDIYLDDLILNLDANFVKIESVFRKSFDTHSKAALVAPHLGTSAITLASKILTRLNVPPINQTVVDEFTRSLHTMPGGQIFTKAGIARYLGLFYWQKRLFALLFKKIQPDFLVLINGYSNHSLVAAARELNVNVVELQHGLLNRHHYGYSWSKYASIYKAQMALPDQIFLYGDYWKEELLATGFWDEQSLRSVGNLYIDEIRRTDMAHQGDVRTILVTTQDIYRQEVIAFVQEFLEIAKDRLAVKIIFKLHPSELDKSIYTNAFSHHDCVMVLGATDMPGTHQLLVQADFHMSISSTCHYEALAFGVPTIILKLPLHENVLHLSQSGHAILCKTAANLYEFITSEHIGEVSEEIKNYYYRPNALANMVAALSG